MEDFAMCPPCSYRDAGRSCRRDTTTGRSPWAPGEVSRHPVRHDYDEAIVEHAHVTTRNGVDQMWVDIIRPDTDEPVPTILISSPYYNTLGRGWEGHLKSPHQGPAVPTSPGFPGLAGSDHTRRSPTRSMSSTTSPTRSGRTARSG
jgi:hypothetical protein